MRNLKKISLLIVIFPVIILLSSVFAQKAVADIPQCDELGKDLECSGLGNRDDGCQDSTKPFMCLSKTPFLVAEKQGNFFNQRSVVCCNVPTAAPAICIKSGGFFSGSAGTFECCSGLTKCSSTKTCETSCVTVPSKENEFCDSNTPCTQGLICNVDNTVFNSGRCQKPAAPVPPAAPPTAKFIWKNIAQCVVRSPDDCGSFNNFACPKEKTCKNKQDVIDNLTGDITSLGTCEKEIASAQPTATPAPAATPVIFSCINQTGPSAGNYQCRGIVNGSTQCENGFSSFSPSSPFTGTSCTANEGCCKQGQAQSSNPFACADQARGEFAGIYACGPFTNGFAQCPGGFSEFTPNSTFTGTSCNSNQRCCKKDSPLVVVVPPAGQSSVALTNCAIGDGAHFCSVENPKTSFPPCSPLFGPGQTANCAQNPSCWFCPLPVPASAPTSACLPSDCSGAATCAAGSECKQVAGTFTKSCSCQSTATASTTTPAQASTTLAVTLNAQDIVLTADTLTAGLSLFNLSSNTLVSGAPATSTFNKTPIPGKQFAANIPISGLLKNKFFLLIRKDNLIARTFFSIDSSASITVPTTTLVFGDLNTDNDISILDYNIFIGCFGKLATDTGCASSDFDLRGKIDAIDYNIWLRGLVTWKKEI